MGASYCILGDYVSALKILTEVLGTGHKIDVPISIIEDLGESDEKVINFLALFQLIRFLSASFMADVLPGVDKVYVTRGVMLLAYEAAKPATEIVLDKSKLERVIERYVEAGLTREAAETDVKAVQYLAKVYEIL